MKKYTLRALSGFLVALMLLPLWLVPVSADGEAPAIDTLIEAVRLTTNEKGEARLCSPLGIRFVTSFSLSAYETLKNDARVESVRQGTLIAPMDTVLEAGAFTKEALGERSYLDVAATDEAWYSVDQRNDTACFAGSVWEIRAEHINTTFAGVGYLEVTLKDGEVLTVYGATDPDRIPSVTLAIASVIGLRRNDLNDAQIYALTQLKNKFDGDDEMLYRQDFKNLNVLAIGDSLFSGAFDTVGDKVWVNLLGKTYSWNLTNLGVGGATLTYDPDRTASNKSMYGMLMNDPDYSYGSPSYYSAGTPSQNADEVDLILLEGGSNDYGSSVQAPLGAIADRTPDTFLGAWYLMVDELLSRYSNATIVLLTAWENVNQNREDGALAIDYTSSVKKVYTTYYKNNPRVRFINAGDPDVSGVNMLDDAFRSQYSYDRFHLNDAGMELMAEHMLPLVWEAVAETTGTPREGDEQMQYDMSGLNVLALGDSLFYGANSTTGKEVWINSIGKDCAWNLTNLGIGGATVSYDPDRTATNFSMYEHLFGDENYKYGSRDNSKYYNSGYTVARPKEDVDVIFLEAGSNDYGTKVQAPMGTVDSDDPATFLGSWRLVTEELLRQYPNAIVIFITAWENGNQTREDGAIAAEYTSSVVTLYDQVYAENDRVYLIDAGDPAVSGVDMRNSVFKKTYAYDAFHLNDAGMALMAQNMLPLVWDVIKNQSGIR